jgi:hypothetical protein
VNRDLREVRFTLLRIVSALLETRTIAARRARPAGSVSTRAAALVGPDWTEMLEPRGREQMRCIGCGPEEPPGTRTGWSALIVATIKCRVVTSRRRFPSTNVCMSPLDIPKRPFRRRLRPRSECPEVQHRCPKADWPHSTPSGGSAT